MPRRNSSLVQFTASPTRTHMPIPSRPLVTVVICNYNYRQYLQDAIHSALTQTYQPLELIVVDDGSTDGSWELLQSQPSCIRCLRIPHSGQLAAYWAGIEASRGSIICFLDSDDVYRPTKVETIVSAFIRMPAAEWVCHTLEFTDANLMPFGLLAANFRQSGPSPNSPHHYLERLITLSTSGLAMRRTTAYTVFHRLRAQLQPLSNSVPFGGLQYHADACIAAVIAALNIKGYRVFECLTYYRRHGDRQRGEHDRIRSALETERNVTKLVIQLYNAESGQHSQSSHFYKCCLVLDALNTGSSYTRRRTAFLMRGALIALRLAKHDVALALRQCTAILFSYLAPHLWVKRLARRGYV